MTPFLILANRHAGRHLPERALVIVLSLGGLIASLALAAATWPQVALVAAP